VDVLAKNIETKRSGSAENDIINSILYKCDSLSNYYYVSQNDLFEGKDNLIRIAGINGSLTGGISIESVINKMKINSMPLGSITNILMGLVSRADTVSSNHFRIDKNLSAKKGDGIFVLSQKELDNLELSPLELKTFVRPFFKNSDIQQYSSKQMNDLYILYLKDEGLPIILPPSLKIHFERFEFLLTKLKENFLKNEIAAPFVRRWLANGNYFVLFNPKREEYFNAEKIICPYRSKINSFSYNDIEWYASQDVCFILPKSKHVTLKFILAILNSPLCYNWLFFKGKRKGFTLELYATPLSEIPIRLCDPEKQKDFAKIVDLILDNKKFNPQIDTRILETKVNKMVYKLYELSYEEVKVIDPEFALSEDEYDNITLE